MNSGQQCFSLYRLPQARLCGPIFLIILLLPGSSRAQNGAPQPGYDDHKNMMDQKGIKAIRRGPNPNDQSTFDEAKANPYKETMPAVLRMNSGARVTRASQWPKRRAEILEDFAREVYGRIPDNVPNVRWEVT